MQIDILTLFPEVFTSVFSSSIIKRAQDKKIVNIRLINIRDFGEGKHKKVDDKPYGGGIGMILRVDILDRAINHAKQTLRRSNCRTILLDPRGKQFDQKTARRLVKYEKIVFVCGHYEGIDERVKKFTDESLSIGPYILTGGEIPASVITETVVRLLPGVLSKSNAIKDESFSNDLLEYPQYTRPRIYKEFTVPEILFSGNHVQILAWRQSRQQLAKRPKNGRKG